ncbi:conserved exported hypothetical protein [Verrucomicrobia bacterium]|nr:conserved exported hypothetical protein [Verrucomicrobiota bacterium]
MIENNLSTFWRPIRLPVAAAALLSVAFCARAEIRLPAMFSDHMVLQRDIQIPVWGWADQGEKVTVQFGSQTVSTTANRDGKWKIYLQKRQANAVSQTLTVSGRNNIRFTDVLVGDVWVCSGQSNMGLYLGECDNASTEVPNAHDPLLRLLKVEERTCITPEADVKLWNGKKWQVCAPETANQFSGVAYFFGRELRLHIGIPIGLISSTYGGTRAQLWISRDAIERNLGRDPEFKTWLAERQTVLSEYSKKVKEYLPKKEKYDAEMLRYWNEVQTPEYLARVEAWEQDSRIAREQGKVRPPRPEPSMPKPEAPEPPDKGPYNDFMVGNVYNAMIAPLTPYAIKGVIWYQGESNCGKSKQYRTLFPILIQDWREEWKEGDFPFLFVQLPNINKPATKPVQDEDPWPGIREAQSMALRLPNTGMATIIDVGDPDDVHGKDKLDVGNRLSLVARRRVYGENIVCCGPTFDSFTVEGSKVSIAFKNVGGGLMIGAPPWSPLGGIPSPADSLKGFAVASSDRRWVWAHAQIDGDRVVVSSDQVPHPVAVRYGWADNPPCNLYNKERLPATPFRTDNWEPALPTRTALN